MMNNEETFTKKTLGATLRLERERRGWSQKEMADKIETNQVTVSRWEQGVSTPGPYFRQKLAELFGKSLEALGVVEEATVTEKLPLWNVPYHRNPFFTGREEVLSSLHKLFHDNEATALTQIQAISGLGGIGKTQIAIEYAYRYHRHYQATLWFTASSYETLNNDMTMFASLLHLVAQKDSTRHIVVAAVKRWLSTNDYWLLILDNVTDFKMIRDILPTQGTGRILITTRQQALGSFAQNIAVEKMVVDEGITFLLRRTQILNPHAPLAYSEYEERRLAAEIVRELDGLPLALDQAAAYIEETRCGFSAYLDLYRTHRKELLLHRGRLPMEHPDSVTATWSVSFKQIQQESRAAAELLRLLVFFNSEDIPEEVIRDGYAELGTTLGPVVSNPLAMNAAIELLLQYSLLRRTPEKRTLSIHPLVQAVFRDEMDSKEQRLWAERTLHILNKTFPDVTLTPDNLQQCQRLISHVQTSATSIATYGLFQPEAARLLHRAANYLTVRADYEQVEKLLEDALSIREQIFRPTHPDIAATMNDLGVLYTTQGKYQQAAQYLQKALVIRQQNPGPEHPDTATTLHNLAILSFVQGKYTDATHYHQQALEIRQTALPPDALDKAKSLSSFAELLAVQGKYEEAEKLYEDALSIQQRMLKPDHLDLARTLNNRALLHRFKGKYEEAEKHYVQILDTQISVLGDNHPEVAQTYYNQARLYRAQGRYPEAEVLYKKACAIREEVFGQSHPQVAQSYYGLAKLYNSQGDYQLAEEYCQRALNIQEQLLGADHPDVANTHGILGKIYVAQHKIEEAYLTQDRLLQVQNRLSLAHEVNERALTIRMSISDADHPHIALISNNLAEIYQLQGNLQEARHCAECALAIHKKALGPTHAYVAYSLNRLGENYFLEQDFVQAENYFKQALSLRKDRLGPVHPRVASSSQNLARLYVTLGRYEEAEQLYSKSLAIHDKASQRDYPALLTIFESYATLLHTMERENQAREIEERIATIKARLIKPNP